MRRFCAIVFVLGLFLTLSAPCLAAFTVKMGARINQEIGWHFIGKEQSVNGKDGLTDSFLNLPSTSYLRATFMSEDRKVGVRLETGLGDGSIITTRRAFGWYKKGDFTFLAGQTDNWQGAAGAYWPEQKLTQGPGGDSARGWGKIWQARKPKLQVTWQSGSLGFQASLENPSAMPLNYPVGGVDVVNKFPGVGLALDYSGKSFSVTPAFLWAQWQAEGDTAGFDDSLNAYGFILPLAIKAGGFRFILEAHYATNPAGLYRYYETYGRAVTSDMGFEDTRLWGGLGEVSYTTGKLTLALGVGLESYSNDAWKSSLGWKDDQTTRWLGWLTLPYAVHEYFSIRPELDYYNYGDDPEDGESAGAEWIAGVLFRFVF